MRQPRASADDVVALLARQPELKGWTLSQQQSSKGRIAIQARDPILGEAIIFSLSLEDWATRSKVLIQGFARLPEVRLLNSAPKRPSNARLLADVRRTASAYSWSFETYRQVAQLLDESSAIRSEEFEWLIDAGPWSHPFWVGYEHDRPAWRGLPDGSAQEQYKSFKQSYRRAKRRYFKTSQPN